MSSFLAGASVNTSDLNQLSASIDLKLAGKMDAVTGDLELPGKLSLNAPGANTAALSIGGAAVSGNVPVSIYSVSQYALRTESDHNYATIQAYNKHSCWHQRVLHSSSTTNPTIDYDLAATNGSNSSHVTNSFQRFRIQGDSCFEIHSTSGSTTGVRASSYGSISDGRLKWGVTAVSNGLEVVRRLRPVIYDKAPRVTSERPAETTRESGFIAQDVNAVLPHAACADEFDASKPWTLKYDMLTPYLASAIQQLAAEVGSLRARVTELEN